MGDHNDPGSTGGGAAYSGLSDYTLERYRLTDQDPGVLTVVGPVRYRKSNPDRRMRSSERHSTSDSGSRDEGNLQQRERTDTDVSNPPSDD